MTQNRHKNSRKVEKEEEFPRSENSLSFESNDTFNEHKLFFTCIDYFIAESKLHSIRLCFTAFLIFQVLLSWVCLLWIHWALTAHKNTFWTPSFYMKLKCIEFVYCFLSIIFFTFILSQAFAVINSIVFLGLRSRIIRYWSQYFFPVRSRMSYF